MEIYYEYEPVMGVNYQYKDEHNRFVHDYCSSMYLFKLEFPFSTLIEITDENEDFLKHQGKIDNGNS